VPVWLEAGLWGLLAGGALVVGAAVAWFVRVPPSVVAGVMAFGSGVLIAGRGPTPEALGRAVAE
jgi:zinc transporter, ZIP family